MVRARLVALVLPAVLVVLVRLVLRVLLVALVILVLLRILVILVCTAGAGLVWASLKRARRGKARLGLRWPV